MSGQLPEKEIWKLVLEMAQTIKRIETQIERLVELEDRVRELELKQARNSVRWAVLYGFIGALGGMGFTFAKMLMEAVMK